ncbi:MAG: PHP domain-containing protein [Pseudomonadales bacterium]
MTVDLHTHSTASDGALSPAALLARAQGNGVRMLALTDHDSVEGVRELAVQFGDAPGLRLVPGVEISTVIGAQGVHVVGLWVDIEAPMLTSLLAGQRSLREARGQAIGERLARAGIAGAFEGATALAGDAVLSRPHFARYLVAQGHCSGEQQAFKRWLGRGKPADVRCAWPGVDAVVAAIHAASGVAVLAHPLKYQLTRRRLVALLAEFRAAGGDALELVSGAQAPGTIADLWKLAVQHQLACSTGSDFHSPLQTWCDLGCQTVLPDAVPCIWQQYGLQ